MPVLSRTSSATHARASLGRGDGVTIYWRPGCPVCAKLRGALRGHGDRITWVNIREDADAAAFVRTTNRGGQEIVPVAVIDGVAHSRPTPRQVLAALR
ncbi:glutaredoxin family protein [Nocardioides dongxiaopingii]|uniref:glutaredoxin family protein n=1 Tax=Nocardioides dongxiaopingii TaxID=2576036 RepID=UPI0010C76E76|nr:glutaredoxin domain-containing protein [Nocardioides dongxiaopingii]